MRALADTFGGNSGQDYALCVFILVIGVALVKIVSKIFNYKIKRLMALEDLWLSGLATRIVAKNATLILYFGVFYLAVNTLYMSAEIDRAVGVVGIIFVSAITVRILSEALEDMFTRIREDNKGQAIIKEVPRGLITVAKTAMWGIAVIFVMDNMGLNVSALIAGIGIGGVALALASQTVLGDLFNYFVILFDKPFQQGDFIAVGDKLGMVKYIGIKTTRLQALGGEELVFSNADLATSRIHNFKKMEKRRVAFSISVAGKTSSEKLKLIQRAIREIITDIENAQLDRAHFSVFKGSALVFEIVYYVAGSDYTRYMNIQQSVNIAIKKKLEEMGVEMA